MVIRKFMMNDLEIYIYTSILDKLDWCYPSIA